VNPILALAINSNQTFVLTMIGMGLLVPLVVIIAGAARSAAVNKERERTRRELAAYVAEGSMTADEAERLLKAGPLKRSGASESSCC